MHCSSLPHKFKDLHFDVVVIHEPHTPSTKFTVIISRNLSCMVFVPCSSLSHNDHGHVTHAVGFSSIKGIVYIQGLVWSSQ